ncbi:lysoplasmalogenase [Kineosporia sp. R_H_3]|uniref:lysoplasmalogenase n=1 Tax=Kineosporia sp. R_H_3 TaxID=1961848 RepID=UPI000B4B1625|nr:lysoplasmalogenase [Kineosporia sp. R_H_3]
MSSPSAHPGRRRSLVRAARLAYGALAVADVLLSASASPGAARARKVTKPLLMPALMVGRSAPTRRALALSGAGDVALLGSSDAAFTAGLGAFLAGQVAWVRALHGRGGGLLARRPAVAVPYVVAAVGLNAYLWRRAGKDRLPLAAYSAALTSMALAAADTGDPLTAAGGALFMASDGLIALDRFGGVRLPAQDAWVMGTYTAAQALLARD